MERYLRRLKNMLTKEEFIVEIKNFLYKKAIGYSEEEEVNNELDLRWRWFETYYGYYTHNKSLDIIKDEFLTVFQTFSFDEYIDKIKFYLNEDTNFQKIKRVDEVINKPLILDDLHYFYDQGIEKNDFYHAIQKGVSTCWSFV